MTINYLYNLWVALKDVFFRSFYGLLNALAFPKYQTSKFSPLLLFFVLTIISNDAFSQAACNANAISAYSDPACGSTARAVGAGEYGTMNMVSGVRYQFDVTNDNAQTDGVCVANASLGAGIGPFYYTAGSTAGFTVAVYRNATGYISTSATLNYKIFTPTATNGSTATIADGGTRTMVGNNPATSNAQSGTWSIVSGPNTDAASQFANVSTYNTVFTPRGGPGAYVTRWTLNNGGCTHAADATVTVSASLCGTGSLQADYADPVCSPTTFGAAGTPGTGVGGGERKRMYFYNGFNYTFSLALNSNTQINGICIGDVNKGVGTGPWSYTHTGADGYFEVSTLRTSTTWSTQSAQLTYEKLTCSTITLAANAPGAATLCGSNTKVPIQAFSGAITVGNGNLTVMSFTTTGTYAQADITKYQLWYHTSDNLAAASQVGADLASSGGAGARSFAAFTTPTLTNGNTYYFWITVDVAASLTGATIACNATTTGSLTYAGTVAGSTNVGGTQTFNGTVTLAQPSPVAAASVCASTLKVPIQSFSLLPTTCNGNLTVLSFTTTGTYAQADIAKYQLWKSATNDITTAAQLGVDLASSGTAGARSFATFASPTLTSGTTYYFWITVDITGSPTNNNTIACNAVNTAGLTSTSTKAGSTSAGGTITINTVSTGGSVTPTPQTICSGANSGVLTLGGHAGSVTRWESSPASDFSGATNIANTSTTYTSGALTATTYFRAVVTLGACPSANSAGATVNVTPIPAAPAGMNSY